MKYIGATLLAALLITTNATALVINLGQTNGSPSDPTSEYNRLVAQVSLYNSVNNPDLPDPDESLFVKTPTSDSPKSIALDLTDLNGYLLFKWGNKNQFYYVENETLTTFASTAFGRTGGTTILGLSHYSSWLGSNNTGGDGDGDPDPTPVGDAANSLALLGMGIGAIKIGGTRRNK